MAFMAYRNIIEEQKTIHQKHWIYKNCWTVHKFHSTHFAVRCSFRNVLERIHFYQLSLNLFIPLIENVEKQRWKSEHMIWFSWPHTIYLILCIWNQLDIRRDFWSEFDVDWKRWYSQSVWSWILVTLLLFMFQPFDFQKSKKIIIHNI